MTAVPAHRDQASRAEISGWSPTLPVLAWSIFVLVLPFFEGGGSPEGLLISHLALLAAVSASARAIGPLSAPLVLASGAVLAVSGLSGALGGYRFASLIAIVDLAALLVTLVVAEALCRARSDARGALVAVLALSGLAQAALVLVPWIASGFSVRGPGSLLNSNHTAAYLLLALWAIVILIGRSTREASHGSAYSIRPSDGVEAEGAARAAERSVHSEPVGERCSSPVQRGGASDRVAREMRWVLGGAGAIVLVACLLQASRGALAGLVAGGALFLALRSGRMTRRALRLSWGALILILVAGAGLVAHRLLTKEDPFAWERVRLWGVALRVATEHPILGVGPDVYEFVTAPFDIAREDWPVRFGKHVEATHSDALRVLAETGVLGAAAFLAMLIIVLRGAARGVRERGVRESALAAALAGLLVQATVENLSARPAVSYTGALLAAILIAEGARRARAGAFMSHATEFPASGRSPCAGQWDPSDAGRLERTGPGDRWEGEDGTRRPASAPAGLRRGILLHGGILSAAFLLVIAPYLGHRAFTLFRTGGPLVAKRYASAIHWSPLHSDYRAALAEAVLAGPAKNPADLRVGFLTIDGAIALKPIDPGYYLIRARLARRAFQAGPGETDWIAMADGDYTHAARLDPFRPQAPLERAWMFESIGNHAVALEGAEAALQSEPNSFEAHRLRTVALFELGRLEEARRGAADARRRHRDLQGFVPSNPYEAQVLRWVEAGWAEIEAKLAKP